MINKIIILQSAATVFIFSLFVTAVCEGRTKIGAAVVEIEIMEKALHNFENDVKRLPTNEEGLEAITAPKKPISGWRGPYLKKILPRDPWGNEYRYIYPSIYGTKKFDLYSFGANGIDAHGNDDDVSNWKDYDKKYYKDSMLWRDRLFILFQFAILVLIILYIVKRNRAKANLKT